MFETRGRKRGKARSQYRSGDGQKEDRVTDMVKEQEDKRQERGRKGRKKNKMTLQIRKEERGNKNSRQGRG